MSKLDENGAVCPNLIIEVIRNRRALVVIDTAIDENLLATHWIITTLINSAEASRGIESSRWENRMTPTGEGIRLLMNNNMSLC